MPRWLPRLVLTGLWGLAAAVLIATSADGCTAADPCWPDPLGMLLFFAGLATPVLLWWVPRFGCVWGAAFAMAMATGDDLLVVRAACAVLGLACVLVARRYWQARVRQRQLAAIVAAGDSRPVPPMPLDPSGVLVDPRRDWSLLTVGAAGLALLSAVGMAGWYLHLDRTDTQHRDRAITVDAEVVEVDELDDWVVTFAVPSASGEVRPVVLEVWDADGYAVGVRAPMRVDPTDEAWVELVAEPSDRTDWLGGATAALLLAVVLGARELRRRWAVTSLWLGPLPAVDVLLVPDEAGDALVLWPDADPATSEPVAWLPLAGLLPALGSALAATLADGDEPEDRAEQEAAFARAWRGEDDPAASVPEPATLLGSFHDGGWVAAVTPDGTLVPAGPLRACTDTLPGALRRPWGWLPRSAPPSGPSDAQGPSDPVGRDVGQELGAAAAEDRGARSAARVDDGLPGVPVAPAAWEHLPSLPLTVPAARRTRLLGLARVAGASVGVPAFLLLLGVGPVGLVIAALGGLEMLSSGMQGVRAQLHLTPGAIEVRTAWRSRSIAWAALHGVRREGARLSLAWGAGEILELPELAAASADRIEGARSLGAIIAALQERAVAVEPPDAPVTTRWGGSTWVVAGAYGVVVLAVHLAVWTGWLPAPLL